MMVNHNLSGTMTLMTWHDMLEKEIVVTVRWKNQKVRNVKPMESKKESQQEGIFVILLYHLVWVTKMLEPRGH